MTQLIHFALITMVIAFYVCFVSSVSARSDQEDWQIGAPIATYWAGPPMTDATARA
jgi:hypothetical protein